MGALLSTERLFFKRPPDHLRDPPFNDCTLAALAAALSRPRLPQPFDSNGRIALVFAVVSSKCGSLRRFTASVVAFESPMNVRSWSCYQTLRRSPKRSASCLKRHQRDRCRVRSTDDLARPPQLHPGWGLRSHRRSRTVRITNRALGTAGGAPRSATDPWGSGRLEQHVLRPFPQHARPQCPQVLAALDDG